MTEDDALAGLAGPRRGHFDLGTGFHGDLWLDLDALFLRPALLRPHVARLAGHLSEYRADAVCGPMEGGALLGYAVADALEAAFLPAHRGTATPGADATAYRLPDVPGGIGGWRVAIVDDAVNAGTAVLACGRLLGDAGAVPVAVGALLGLGPASGAVAAAMSVPFHAVATLESAAWPAGRCPLCADGVPLDLVCRARQRLGYASRAGCFAPTGKPAALRQRESRLVRANGKAGWFAPTGQGGAHAA